MQDSSQTYEDGSKDTARLKAWMKLQFPDDDPESLLAKWREEMDRRMAE